MCASEHDSIDITGVDRGSLASSYRKEIYVVPDYFETTQGTRVLMRLIRSDDAPLLLDLFEQLTPESRRRRFHATVQNIDLETRREAAAQLANVDNLTQGGAVIALLQEDDREVVVGVARLARPAGQPHHAVAEAAVAVRDDLQKQAIGAALLHRLVLLAGQMGIETMVAEIEADNQPALKLFRSLHLPTETTASHGEVALRISIPPIPQQAQ